MGVPNEVPSYLFPPENAFSERMIPALLAAGVKAVLVDNIHFDRCVQNYPFSTGENLFPPNPADQRMPNSTVKNWVGLNGVWDPSKVSVPYGYQPHYVQYTNPITGEVSKIIAVPGARYEGVEDARGGFGALDYQNVMGQLAFANTDPNHPVLVMMAHDGDNYGGGTNSYYQNNWQNMVSWLQGNQAFQCTTVADYLQQYPPAADDVIHVEDGSWSGANNGDPLFLKWNPNFFSPVYEPERNSFQVMVAGMNRVLTAQTIAPYSSLENILAGTGTATEKALHFMLVSQASDYEYWPTILQWNSDATIGVNAACVYADQVIATGQDTTPPTVFLPQREFWNPGAVNWNPSKPDPAIFAISTAVYDVSGLVSVTLSTFFSPGLMAPTPAMMVYSFTSAWNNTVLQPSPRFPSQTVPLPTYIADLYTTNVTCGACGGLISYYVTAIDTKKNTQQSPLQYVYVPRQY